MKDKTKYTRELLNKTIKLLTESSKKSITESTDFFMKKGTSINSFIAFAKKKKWKVTKPHYEEDGELYVLTPDGKHFCELFIDITGLFEQGVFRGPNPNILTKMAKEIELNIGKISYDDDDY